MNSELVYTYFVYNTILILSAVFSFLAEYSVLKSSRIISRFLLFFILFIPAAIRYDIGTDYSNYIDLYNSLNNTPIEIGYYYINLFVHHFHLSTQWIFAISSFITYSIVCFGLHGRFFCLTIIFYVLLLYLWSYSIIRQAIAMSFIILAMNFLIYGKNKRYFICIILATFFHYSSIILIPLFFVNKFSLNKKTIILFILCCIICIFNSFLIDFLFNSSLITNSKYSVYLTSTYNRNTEIGSGIGVFISLLVPLASIFYYHRIIQSDNRLKGILNMNLLYILFYCMALNIYIFNRVSNLFSFAPIMIIAPLTYVISNKKKRYILISSFILLHVLMYEKIIFISSKFLGEGLGISPYTTIFN